MVAVVYMEQDLLAAEESCIATSSFCDAGQVMDSSQKRGAGQTYTTFLFPSFFLLFISLSSFPLSRFLLNCKTH
jgi:hypothetical protein